MLFLVLVQALRIFQSAFEINQQFSFGRQPDEGIVPVPGNIDDPFSDCSLVCVKTGRSYRANQLNIDLTSMASQVDNKAGRLAKGFRVISRSELVQDTNALAYWSHVCELFLTALPHIEDSCMALGCNVVTDALRIVDGLESQTTKLVANALPIVILPVVDITRLVRFAIPSRDGIACIFQLVEPVDSTTLLSMIGVDRLARVYQPSLR